MQPKPIDTLPGSALCRPPQVTEKDPREAGQNWGFNCGPAALCALLNLTPAEIRPHLGDFEQKRYTNPTMIQAALTRCGATWRQTYRSDEPLGLPMLDHGLIRVQWAGPWTQPGVPLRARYPHTHWVAMRNKGKEVFVVNDFCYGG